MPDRGQSFWKNISSLVSEPVFKGTFSGLFFELFKPQRPPTLKDESVAAFFSRRFGQDSADNLASALLHGIYAGDINQLSVRSIFPKLWLLEGLDRSVVKGVWKSTIRGTILIPKEDVKLLETPLNLVNSKGWGAFTFLGGIGELADTLVNKLEKSHNVTIQKQTIVQSLKLHKAQSGIQV